MQLFRYATCLAFFLTTYFQSSAQSNMLKTPGTALKGTTHWRGVFQVSSGQEIPFNFLLTGNTPSERKMILLNGQEKFDAGKITQQDDSLFISLDQFDNELAFKIGSNELTGSFRKQDGTGKPIAVKAEKNRKDRFPETNLAPAGDISGTYDIRFAEPGGEEEKAVGLFSQKGKKLTATFLRITGDSRYLEGIVEGNHFYLSSFIGSRPSYYEGSFTADKKITGTIGGIQSFSGVPDENASLPDAYSLTLLKDGYNQLDFSFPDINGKKVSLKDDKFKNKVVIITIGGTWCPNCVDETAFLAPWYINNRDRGVEIISLQYERKTDDAFVKKVVGRFRQRYNIQYDQLVVGLANKEQVAASLPALNTFLSFPTTIFVGRDGKVSKIHTGFNGPATGKYYDEFKNEFNKEVDNLVNTK